MTNQVVSSITPFGPVRQFGTWMSTRTTTKAAILQAIGLAVLLTSILTVIGWQVNGTNNWVEIASVAFGFATVWLCVKESRWNYPLNVISVILLAYVFWEAELYGSMALNLYLIPTLIYGWFVWGRDENTKPIQHVSWTRIPLYVGFTALTWWGATSIIHAVGGQLSILDGWLLVGSILAQYLLDRKKIEAWMVFVLVNIVSVYVYFQAGLAVLSFQFALFLLNAGFAWFVWHRTMRDNKIEKVAA